MRTLELKNLKDRKDLLQSELKSMNSDLYLFKVKQTSLIREYLCSKFDNISEIIMNDTNLIINIKRVRYVYEININNNAIYHSYSFNPRLSWSSNTISTNDTDAINYINIVGFIANQMKDIENSELFIMIKNLFDFNNIRISEIYKLSSELGNITKQIDYIIHQIKLDDFMNKLSNGNFYYHLSNNRWSGDSHHIVYVNKINPKTINIVFNNTRNIENLKSLMDNVSNPYANIKRVKKSEIFKILEKYDLIDTNIDEFILNTKFKNSIKRIKKEKGVSFVRDIKLLCKTLKEMNVTNVNVPDNDTLSYISKWRHNVLENK